MQINIKTSASNQSIVTQLTRKLTDGTKENVIARIALGYSLSTGKRFAKQEFNSYDSQGKEYKDHILFDEQYRDFYIALICQAYGITKNDESIPKYIKLHIDHGLEKINYLFEHNPQYSFFDFLTEYLGKGIDAIEDAPTSYDSVKNNNQHITKSEFSGAIKIKVGYDIANNDDIYCCFNDSTKYNNQHIAIAGKSGSGKTQFALEFLRQLYHQSHGQVNFLFLDFKGLSENDKEKMGDFFAETHTECINAPHKPFPLNPISFIDNVNEKNKLIGINKFVDIIAKYSNIGKKQQQILKEATKEAFLRNKDGKHPTLKDIYEVVMETVETRDTLTEITERLSEYELFASKNNDPSVFLNSNYYFSLSGELDNTVRFTSIFLIINYIFNVFTNMGGTDVVDGNRSMRYVLMIDEAHDLFREKKSLEILEVLLRKIRSYGVSIVLLSQGISEYNQSNFDFSQECETAFLLPINDLNNTKAINKFLGLTEKDSVRAMRKIEKLKNGLCVSNIKELPKSELFKIVQYWKEKEKSQNVVSYENT